MAGSKKTNRRRRPPPITAELIEMGTDDVSDLNKGIVFCLKHQWCRRFPAWERKLLEDARDNLKPCLLYAREILSGDWPELEPFLPSSLESLEEYLQMRPGPLSRPALEKAILADVDSEPNVRARAAFLYANLSVQGRWQPGEGVILDATKPADSYSYYLASKAVAEAVEAYRKLAFPRKAWPEVVRMIRAGECCPDFMVDYCLTSRMDWRAEVTEGLLKIPMSDADDPVAREKRKRLPRAAHDFAEHVVKGRWEEGEGLLGSDPADLCRYAKDVIKDVLPDNLHQIMLMQSFISPIDRCVKKYFVFVARKEAENQAGQPAGT